MTGEVRPGSLIRLFDKEEINTQLQGLKYPTLIGNPLDCLKEKPNQHLVKCYGNVVKVFLIRRTYIQAISMLKSKETGKWEENGIITKIPKVFLNPKANI